LIAAAAGALCAAMVLSVTGSIKETEHAQ
jgi:hypothetical protein